MPFYRNLFNAEVVHSKAGSGRDKELAASPAWAKTPDAEDAKFEASSDLNAAPESLVIPDPAEAV